jgi:hypothetical protein
MRFFSDVEEAPEAYMGFPSLVGFVLCAAVDLIDAPPWKGADGLKWRHLNKT